MILKTESELRKLSRPVTIEEAKPILEKLKTGLAACSNGVGLSAPQIGELVQVCVLNIHNKTLELVNPRIVYHDETFVFRNEGCLSFPGLWLDTIRYNHVVVVDDLNGETVLKNFGAVVAQHEIDHLGGVVFKDRAVPDIYHVCFCGSGAKFKFCCMKSAYGNQGTQRI